MRTVALVLAGGIGSRLYPASRGDRPKQFLPIGGDESLLSRTAERASFADDVVVATRPRFANEIDEHVPEADVLIEPDGKDTGPALTYATHRIRELYGDASNESLGIVALPSDHYVGDDAAFRETMTAGAHVAGETGRLVTFGVTPERPETGYGYIEPGTARTASDTGFREVRAFHEKPDADTAREYVDAGYRWNSGMFAWTPGSFLDAAADSPLEPLVEALDDGDAGTGFDADFAWDDLGSWDALDRVLPPDGDGNVAIGEHSTIDAADNVVVSDDKHVSLVGVSGLAVVAYDDRVLVVPKGEAQRVRELVSLLAENGTF